MQVRALPERGTVALEVPLPLADRRPVPLRVATAGILPLYLGETPAGDPVVGDLADMPHLLVAGTTGSGKTAFLQACIGHLLYQTSARLVLVDPKGTEFTSWQGLPQVGRIRTESGEAAEVLDELVDVMEARYRSGEPLRDGRIVLVVDELADLLSSNRKAVESSLVRLAQKGRAAGIHLIVATQRPSVDVISGVIKANFPCRLAFQLRTMTDSRVVLDCNGAEGLLGRGDGLLLQGPSLQRLHGPLVSAAQVAAVRRRAETRGALPGRSGAVWTYSVRLLEPFRWTCTATRGTARFEVEARMSGKDPFEVELRGAAPPEVFVGAREAVREFRGLDRKAG